MSPPSSSSSLGSELTRNADCLTPWVFRIFAIVDCRVESCVQHLSRQARVSGSCSASGWRVGCCLGFSSFGVLSSPSLPRRWLAERLRVPVPLGPEWSNLHFLPRLQLPFFQSLQACWGSSPFLSFG